MGGEAAKGKRKRNVLEDSPDEEGDVDKAQINARNMAKQTDKKQDKPAQSSIKLAAMEEDVDPIEFKRLVFERMFTRIQKYCTSLVAKFKEYEEAERQVVGYLEEFIKEFSSKKDIQTEWIKEQKAGKFLHRMKTKMFPNNSFMVEALRLASELEDKWKAACGAGDKAPRSTPPAAVTIREHNTTEAAVPAAMPAVSTAEVAVQMTPPRDSNQHTSNAAEEPPQSTGDALRDKAVTILTQALTPQHVMSPLQMAALLERAIFFAHQDPDGAPGKQYKCQLHSLWKLVSPDSCHHILGLQDMILSGDVSMDVLVNLDHGVAVDIMRRGRVPVLSPVAANGTSPAHNTSEQEAQAGGPVPPEASVKAEPELHNGDEPPGPTDAPSAEGDEQEETANDSMSLAQEPPPWAPSMQEEPNDTPSPPPPPATNRDDTVKHEDDHNGDDAQHAQQQQQRAQHEGTSDPQGDHVRNPPANGGGSRDGVTGSDEPSDRRPPRYGERAMSAGPELAGDSQRSRGISTERETGSGRAKSEGPGMPGHLRSEAYGRPTSVDANHRQPGTERRERSRSRDRSVSRERGATRWGPPCKPHADQHGRPHTVEADPRGLRSKSVDPGVAAGRDMEYHRGMPDYHRGRSMDRDRDRYQGDRHHGDHYRGDRYQGDRDRDHGHGDRDRDRDRGDHERDRGYGDHDRDRGRGDRERDRGFGGRGRDHHHPGTRGGLSGDGDGGMHGKEGEQKRTPNAAGIDRGKGGSERGVPGGRPSRWGQDINQQ